MNKYVLSIALLMASAGAFAQNRLVKKAQGLLNLPNVEAAQIEEAQQYLNEALNSGETKDMAMAWNTQAKLNQRLFADELNKASAHQPLDTTVFVKNLYACIDALQKCGEYDTEKEYEAESKASLKQYRMFVYYAGVFNLQNAKYADAYSAFDKWMKYPVEVKMLADDSSLQDDKSVDKGEVGYYACLAAYQGKDFDNVSTYLKEALTYTKEAKTVRQLQMMGLLEKGDTVQWEKVSREYGAQDETTAQNLIAYYLKANRQDDALSFADELIAKDPSSKLANYAKGVVLFGQKKFEEALPFFQKAIDMDPEYTDAYYNAGVCCCNVGSAINDKISDTKFKTKADYEKELAKVKDWYGKAEPYFLKLKQLLPDDSGKWAYNLKSVYYVIGDKEKEAEMDAYLK